MISGKKILAIIPARGGSKRLHRKNILELAGKPLIAWTIEAAKNCPYFDEIVVSTDDAEIRDISLKYGAKVPFIRPEYISNDTATSIEVIKHTVNFYLTSQNLEFDFVVLLQPTSPLRTTQHINEALELAIIQNASAIISVCRTEHSPLWSNTLPSDCSMNGFIRSETKNIRSQDLPVYYRLNGAIYIIKTSVFDTEQTLFPSSNSFAYIMPNEYSTDIDTEIDFIISDAILNKALKS